MKWVYKTAAQLKSFGAEDICDLDASAPSGEYGLKYGYIGRAGEFACVVAISTSINTTYASVGVLHIRFDFDLGTAWFLKKFKISGLVSKKKMRTTLYRATSLFRRHLHRELSREVRRFHVALDKSLFPDYSGIREV